MNKEFLQFLSISSGLLVVITSITLISVNLTTPRLSPASQGVETGSITIALIALLIISVMLLIVSLIKGKKKN